MREKYPLLELHLVQHGYVQYFTAVVVPRDQSDTQV
jgi:hypothetical protein